MEGNQKKMREALVESKKILWKIARMLNSGPTHPAMAELQADVILSVANEEIPNVQIKIGKALAKPPRNCDVGTAEEQGKRWERNCGHGIPRCGKCAVYAEAKRLGLVKNRHLMACDCKFIWAQMPYDEGGAA